MTGSQPEEALSMEPDAIVISPGPGKPSDAGVCIGLIRQLKGRIPILGVCLGHQAIGEAFGATVTHASRLMHGKTSLLTDVADDIIFKGIKKPVQVARYHSLSVQESTLPGRTGSDGAQRGRGDHGHAAQGISHIRTAVSSRVGDDAGRTCDDTEFSGGGRNCCKRKHRSETRQIKGGL